MENKQKPQPQASQFTFTEIDFYYDRDNYLTVEKVEFKGRTLGVLETYEQGEHWYYRTCDGSTFGPKISALRHLVGAGRPEAVAEYAQAQAEYAEAEAEEAYAGSFLPWE